MSRNPSQADAIQSISSSLKRKKKKTNNIFFCYVKTSRKAFKPANMPAMQPSLKATTCGWFNNATLTSLISVLKIICVIGPLGETYIIETHYFLNYKFFGAGALHSHRLLFAEALSAPSPCYMSPEMSTCLCLGPHLTKDNSLYFSCLKMLWFLLLKTDSCSSFTDTLYAYTKYQPESKPWLRKCMLQRRQV